MAKVWKIGDKIPYSLLNQLQEKADAYDALQAAAKENRENKDQEKEDQEAGKDLKKMKAEELKGLAAKKGISVEGLKKDEIIAALENLSDDGETEGEGDV